jgi:uncharacterized membrane protein
MAPDEDVRQQLAALSARVSSLEAEVRVLRGVPADPAMARGVASDPAGDPRGPAAQRTPAVGGVLAASAKTGSSLESRIGAQLLNRVGILAVLIGMAWFLKLAFDRDWIGPGIRILVGLACAAGLMGWSERFRRQGFTAFSYSLKALGTSIAYLSLWAASSIFHLAPSWLIFLAMTAVTIANAVLARRQDSELLGVYALAGGLATPALLSMGQSNQVFLFSYLALLNAGALLLLALHPWKRLAAGALLGTAVYYVGWTFNESSPSGLPLTLLFLALFFAGFAAAPLLILRRSGLPALSPSDSLFLIVFPTANAAATFVALMVLLGDAMHHPWRPWVTLVLALACLLLARVSPATLGSTLSRTHLGLGIFFITVAVPLQFDGYVVTLCWLGESLVLVALAKAGSDAALRVFATVLVMVAALSVCLDWFAATPRPLAVVANMHFASSLIAAGVFAAVTWLSLSALGAYPERSRAFGSWTYLAGFASVAFSVTLLVAVSLEIHHYWFCGAGFFRDFCGGYGRLRSRTTDAAFGYSAWCMIYGAALMTMGFLRRSAFLRWQALVLLAFSIAKVFLNVGQQSQGYRVLSFLGLGVLLLAISFAYQRDWLGLRG